MKAIPHILLAVLILAFAACARRESVTADLTAPHCAAVTPGELTQKSSAPTAEADRINVALYKAVGTGLGAHKISPPSHLVDGKLNTQAANRSTQLDFHVDLSRYGESELDRAPSQVYAIDEIVIRWAMYGARFRGAPGAKNRPVKSQPYVVSYKIEYRDDDMAPGKWTVLHACATSPETERAPNVKVEVLRPEKSQYTGYVTTRIQDLSARRIQRLRLTAASGMHWIGCYEFEAYGAPENTDS